MNTKSVKMVTLAFLTLATLNSFAAGGTIGSAGQAIKLNQTQDYARKAAARTAEHIAMINLIYSKQGDGLSSAHTRENEIVTETDQTILVSTKVGFASKDSQVEKITYSYAVLVDKKTGEVLNVTKQ